MNPETKASFRVAVLMAAFVGVAAALSLALGNGAENVWVPAGPGEQHQDVSAIHTATATTMRPASRTEPKLRGDQAMSSPLRHC
jgi:hypothetical protein